MLVYQRVTFFLPPVTSSHQSEPAQVYAFASILTFGFLQESHVFRMELWKTLDSFRPKSVDSSNRKNVAGTGSVFAMKFKGGLGTTLKMSRKKQCSEVGSCARGERFVGAVNRRKLDKKCVEDSPT